MGELMHRLREPNNNSRYFYKLMCVCNTLLSSSDSINDIIIVDRFRNGVIFDVQFNVCLKAQSLF